MVSGLRMDGGPHILSARVRNTIQSIKEIVGDHSDAEIYIALKESNMDPNETTQKLLNQDPFHEVKRKRDKKKENIGYKGSTEPRKYNAHIIGQGTNSNTYADRRVRRGNISRNALPAPGISREFRVVRDNRNSLNAGEMKPPASLQSSKFADEQVISLVSAKGLTGPPTPSILSLPSGQALDGPSGATREVVTPEERHSPASGVASMEQAVKPSDPQTQPLVLPPTNSVVGVYSSSSDPVHVPSPDSRSAGSVGAIKREVGAVGVRRQTSENSPKHSSQSSHATNTHLGRDRPSSRESFRPASATSKSDKPGHSSTSEPGTPYLTVVRPFPSNQHNNRPHQQQLAGHQKATQPNKEWKPKSSQKSGVNGLGVIGMPGKSVTPPPVDEHIDSETKAVQLEDDEPMPVNSSNDQKVIIADHIRVTETDRSRLTFGSFGAEVDSPKNLQSGFQTIGSSELSYVEPSMSLSTSATEYSGDETLGNNKHAELLDGQAQKSGSESGASDTVSENQNQILDTKESSTSQNLENFADLRLVQDHNTSHTPSESQQPQETPELLPSFSAYDPQTGYDIPYFRPAMDEAVIAQDLPSPHEPSSLNTANTPASSIAMIQQQQQQQQQQQMAQMYPQVHVSHYANLMPYRQYIPPVYVPQMPMPGYSNNPTYSHPSNGSSYVLMPGASPHMSASNLKYGIQQFKPVPAGSPTGFANFSSPNGYAMNTPGVIGSATAMDDSSRLKYKDGNLYVPSQQAETSEIWIQNPRELPGLQSASYYNMAGQTPHAYMPSHSGHASFNAAAAAAAQSSHMQFPGLYHPAPQAAAIGNPHHLAGANVGVAGAAPGGQVGPYQQTQLGGGHLSWTGSF